MRQRKIPDTAGLDKETRGYAVGESQAEDITQSEIDMQTVGSSIE